jgi:multicomponent Na+:H+ antiporter subunit G
MIALASGGVTEVTTLSGAPLIVTAVLLAFGCLMMLIAAIGLVRFPDFYSRIHPAGNGDTLGQGLVMVALIVAAIATGESWVVWVKMILIIAFIFVVNPTATHALARAAWITGVKPWEKSPTEPAATAAAPPAEPEAKA